MIIHRVLAATDGTESSVRGVLVAAELVKEILAEFVLLTVVPVPQHMILTANMDERSFRINFELTTILYSRGLAHDLYNDFESLRARSRRVTAKKMTERSFIESLTLGVARVASPLL